MLTATALNLVEMEEGELPAPEGWRIESIESLDWAMSRMCDFETQVAQNNALAHLAIARIELRTKALNERAQKGLEFFRGQVAAYAETHKLELLGGGKKKSRTLLHGTVAWRKRGGGLEVKDADALLEWARLQPVESNLLRVKEEPALAEIKKHFESSGELPPGCEAKPETEELSIKPALGGAAHGD